jgi:hypothetical protein
MLPALLIPIVQTPGALPFEAVISFNLLFPDSFVAVKSIGLSELLLILLTALLVTLDKSEEPESATEPLNPDNPDPL